MKTFLIRIRTFTFALLWTSMSHFFVWPEVAVTADIAIEDQVIIPEDIYDLVELQKSNHTMQDIQNNNLTASYYCIMRNLWNRQSHPNQFPKMARISNPVIYSGTTSFHPWMINRTASAGIEFMAETGVNYMLWNEIEGARPNNVNDVAEGQGFLIDEVADPEHNFTFIPRVAVSPESRWLSGTSAIQPSPDWFTGFYLLDTVDENDGTLFSRINIRTYPWDAGTDAGTTYSAADLDIDPPFIVERLDTTYYNGSGIFVGQDGNVSPVAEWECMLQLCTDEKNDCGLENNSNNWPPSNGCDLLKYPDCDRKCNPQVEICQECVPKPGDRNQQVFYKDCCQSNYKPLGGTCQSSNPSDGASPSSPFTFMNLTSLVPACIESQGFENIVDCLQKFSDPFCFDDASAGILVDCLKNAWDGTNEPSGYELLTVIDSNSTILHCFGPIAECISETIEEGFDGIPTCTVESGLDLAECFVQHSATCATSCAGVQWNTSWHHGLALPDFMSCSRMSTRIFDPFCTATSCCPPCIEKLEAFSGCLADEFLRNMFLSCNFQCPFNATASDEMDEVIVPASAEVTFSKCMSATNITVDQDFQSWFKFADCVVEEIIGTMTKIVYLSSVNETNTTISDPNEDFPGNETIQTMSPSSSTTIAPTLATTSTPPTSETGTGNVRVYQFQGLVLRLDGAKALTPKSQAAFEEAMEEFYMSSYGRRRRRLETIDIRDFQTDVTVIDEAPDSRGNTITYNQTMAFSSDGGDVSRETALDLLTLPLSSEEGKQELKTLLQEKDEEFNPVTNVEVQNEISERSGKKSDKSSTAVIIAVVVGVVSSCCCCCAATYLLGAQQISDSQEQGDISDSVLQDTDKIPPPESALPISADNTQSMGQERNHAADNSFHSDSDSFDDENPLDC